MATTTQPTLYEIAEDLRAALASLDDLANDPATTGDGEIPSSLADRLDALPGDFATKVDGVLRSRVNTLATAEGVEVELRRLGAMLKSLNNRAEWLRDYVFQCMLATGQQKLRTKLFNIWVQANGRPSITVVDGAEIPKEFRREEVVVSFDGDAAYRQWKAWRAAVLVLHEMENATEGELEAARAEVKRLELPESIRVILGQHLQIR